MDSILYDVPLESIFTWFSIDVFGTKRLIYENHMQLQ